LGSHWWIDPENKAMWPVLFADDHQPVAAARMQGASGALSETIIGCRDGYLRTFSDDATDDDGEDLVSHVLLGPFSLSAGDSQDAMLAELHGVLADNSGSVTWRVLTASSAEEVADLAVAAVESELAGGTPAVAAFGSWSEARNKVCRPRARGAWAVVWLSSTSRWAYESVTIVANQLGRLR
jgi:hypothetical protein